MKLPPVPKRNISSWNYPAGSIIRNAKGLFLVTSIERIAGFVIGSSDRVEEETIIYMQEIRVAETSRELTLTPNIVQEKLGGYNFGTIPAPQLVDTVSYKTKVSRLNAETAKNSVGRMGRLSKGKIISFQSRTFIVNLAYADSYIEQGVVPQPTWEADLLPLDLDLLNRSGVVTLDSLQDSPYGSVRRLLASRRAGWKTDQFSDHPAGQCKTRNNSAAR